MYLDWRNIVGLAGLILLAVYGPSLLNEARSFSPFRVGALPVDGDAKALILLGTAICGLLLVFRELRRGRR